jgi:hypothetical protein
LVNARLLQTSTHCELCFHLLHFVFPCSYPLHRYREWSIVYSVPHIYKRTNQCLHCKPMQPSNTVKLLGLNHVRNCFFETCGLYLLFLNNISRKLILWVFGYLKNNICTTHVYYSTSQRPVARNKRTADSNFPHSHMMCRSQWPRGSRNELSSLARKLGS